MQRVHQRFIEFFGRHSGEKAHAEFLVHVQDIGIKLLEITHTDPADGFCQAIAIELFERMGGTM